MGRAEGVERTFGPTGEAGEAILLAQARHPITPPGQYLVWVTLMADVPDDGVNRRIEGGVQCNGQLDDAEAGTEMPAGLRNDAQGLLAELFGQTTKLFPIHALQVVRRSHLVEQRGGDVIRTSQAHCALLPRMWPFLRGLVLSRLPIRQERK